MPINTNSINTNGDQRQEKYKSVCDPIYLSLVEQAHKNNTELDISSWVEAKEKIRLELPCPE